MHWFCWCPKDYDAETSHLEDDEDLALRRLIDACFMREGRLPDNDPQLARIIRFDLERWKKARPNVAEFFDIRRGFWRHKLVDTQLRKAERLQESRSLGARLTNAKRYAKRTLSNGAANAERSVYPESDTDSDARFARLEADASPVSSPLRFEETSPHAAKKIFWTRVKKLGVEAGAVAKQTQQVGRDKVDQALAAVERKRPDDPTPFFVACCQDRIAPAADPDQPTWKFEGPTEPPPEHYSPIEEPDPC